jgi:hypothetical protein
MFGGLSRCEIERKLSYLVSVKEAKHFAFHDIFEIESLSKFCLFL